MKNFVYYYHNYKKYYESFFLNFCIDTNQQKVLQISTQRNSPLEGKLVVLTIH